MAGRGRSRRVTNVSPTAVGSGASVMDLFPLPVPMFIFFRFCKWVLKHWYIAIILYLLYKTGPVLSILFMLLIPIMWVAFVGLNNRAHDGKAIIRASIRLARTRQKWRRTVEAADLNNGPKIPRLISLRRPPLIADEFGSSLTFTINLARVAKTVTDLEDEQETMVAVLNARRSRVQRMTPGVAKFTVEWDSVAEVAAKQAKSKKQRPEGEDSIHATQLPSVELDQEVSMELDNHLLVVGKSGSGKSNLTWTLISGLNENMVNYRLYVIDPKQVELADLEHSPYTIMYVDRARDAEKVITKFHSDMEYRLGRMKANGLRKIELNADNDLRILVIDELLLLSGVLKGGDANTPLGEILSIGRAAGFIVVANSQLGQVDTIGRIRDLFPQRVCMATLSSDLTNAVLGPKAEERGARCTEITTPGEGYIYTDTHGTFQRFRPPFIFDTKLVASGKPFVVQQEEGWNLGNLGDKIPKRKRPAYVYRLYSTNHDETRPLYIGKAVNPSKRIKNHVDNQPWGEQIDHSRTVLRKYPTEDEAFRMETEGIDTENPIYNLAQATHAP